MPKKHRNKGTCSPSWYYLPLPWGYLTLPWRIILLVFAFVAAGFAGLGIWLDNLTVFSISISIMTMFLISAAVGRVTGHHHPSALRIDQR